jgi:hypothetical protein
MAEDFVMVRWHGEVMERDGLPDIEYPVPLAFIEAFDPRATRLGLDDLLFWLQCYTEQATADSIAFAPAMRRLAELLALGINGEPDAIEGDRWYVRLGPVDLGTRIVTVQRQQRLIAAVTGAADGRLMVSAFQPLDARTIRMLTGCGVKPAPDGTVCLRPNNWEYTLDASAGMGQVYAADRGETYLSYWEFGIGVSANGEALPDWRRYRDATPWPASLVAAQIAVYAAHGGLG